ncbi:hypothetical protein YC2023_113577 [Brassica napus]
MMLSQMLSSQARERFCEAVIRGELVNKVLKTSAAALVELKMLKNLTGSLLLQAL